MKMSVRVLLLLLFLLLCECQASEHAEPSHHAAAGGEGHGEGQRHPYHVFHVEFQRVEVPFIIALWIFVSSLAKIGKET